jgi:RimJ/RimL family protein N-acetyltransferase
MVSLSPMPPDRFAAFREHAVAHYARDKVDSGVWSPGEAPRRAAAEFDGLLPDGTATGDHFLYSIRNTSSEEVGTVWFARLTTGVGRAVWIYDVEIFDRFRRQGYATQGLRAVEQMARELGADRIELHVFGHNPAAISLYERSGYAPTSIVMSKPLDAGNA